MKRLVIVVLVLLAFVIILSFVKDSLVKASVEKGTEIVTGLPLRIGSLRVGVTKTLIGIRNLMLFNPRGYSDRVMMDMPEMYVDYDLPAILSGRVHLNEMRLNVREFAVVKNKEGELNLDSLNVVKAQKGSAKAQNQESPPEIQIDRLKLKIGRVIYKDYSRGSEPFEVEYNVNIDETYTDIKDAYTLVSLIIARSLTNTAIAKIANIDLSKLQRSISGNFSNAGKAATRVISEAKDIFKDAAKGKLSVEEATEGLKKTTKELKEVLKFPFGEE